MAKRRAQLAPRPGHIPRDDATGRPDDPLRVRRMAPLDEQSGDGDRAGDGCNGLADRDGVSEVTIVAAEANKMGRMRARGLALEPEFQRREHEHRAKREAQVRQKREPACERGPVAVLRQFAGDVERRDEDEVPGRA